MFSKAIVLYMISMIIIVKTEDVGSMILPVQALRSFQILGTIIAIQDLRARIFPPFQWPPRVWEI